MTGFSHLGPFLGARARFSESAQRIAGNLRFGAIQGPDFIALACAKGIFGGYGLCNRPGSNAPEGGSALVFLEVARDHQQERRFALLYALAGAMLSTTVVFALAWLIQNQDWIPKKKDEPEPMRVSLVDDEPDENPDPQVEPSGVPQVDPAPKLNPIRPKAKKKPPKVEKKRPPKKEPPKPKPEAKKTPPPPPKQNMKMVEQLEDKKNKAPENPDYLSNIDRTVKQQTRARVSNLQKDAERAEANPKVQKNLPDKAPDEEDRLAQTEERPESPPQKARPRQVQAKDTPRRPKLAQKQQKLSPLLNMRPAAPKAATAAPTAANKALTVRKSESGTLQAPQQQSNPNPVATRPQNQPLRAPRALNLSGSPEIMAQSLGNLAQAKAAVQRSRRSKKAGVWDKARKRYQSPLENMVPEVRPGNQTALNSRRHPFAKYIATIHRSIHAVWAEGFLRQWDSLPGSSPWNNFERWTRVEIVLLADGRIDSVKTVRPSGHSGFDGVARDTIYTAGPYPEAPAEIRSGNGKVYMHWAFHRNAYACGTFGAEPFILNNAGEGPRPDPTRAVRVEGQGPTSAASGNSGMLAHEHHEHHHSGEQFGPEHRRHRGYRSTSPSQSLTAMGPSAPPSQDVSQSRTESKGAAIPGPRAPTINPGAPQISFTNGETQTPAIRRANTEIRSADHPEQKKRIVAVAKLWVSSVLIKDTSTASRISGYPFSVGGRARVKNKKTLEKALGPVAQELAGESMQTVRLLSAADIVQEFGSLPAGWQPKALHRFVWVGLEHDQFILRVQAHVGRWVVSGFSR